VILLSPHHGESAWTIVPHPGTISSRLLDLGAGVLLLLDFSLDFPPDHVMFCGQYSKIIFGEPLSVAYTFSTLALFVLALDNLAIDVKEGIRIS